jgi:hypothetical protein
LAIQRPPDAGDRVIQRVATATLAAEANFNLKLLIDRGYLGAQIHAIA